MNQQGVAPALSPQARRELVRAITSGRADAGSVALLERLRYEAHLIAGEPLAAPVAVSATAPHGQESGVGSQESEETRQPPQFEAIIVWMHDQPLLQGRAYQVRIGQQEATATMAPLKYRVNTGTLEHVAARTLEQHDIGVCGMALDRPVAFEPYAVDRSLGTFVLVDRVTHATVGVGLLHFELRRSQNIHWQTLDIDRTARAALKVQRPCVVWFTGLSGCGKSTIANLLEKRLHALGRHTYLLDGDNVRHGLNRDLGFTDADRVENIRRVAEVSRLMVDAGLIVLAAFISPFRAERRMARALFDEGDFIEVFVDTPIDVAEARDPKGLYRKARRGELKNFTGVDSPYEPPEHPEIHIDTTQCSPQEAVAVLLAELAQDGED